jgi:hypothetical protein
MTEEDLVDELIAQELESLRIQEARAKELATSTQRRSVGSHLNTL